MSPVYRALAPAKINLGLFLGPIRSGDGRHELVSVMQSISLADELTLEAAPAGVGVDEVLCPGVPGPQEQNLAAQALSAFRESTGWDAAPARAQAHPRCRRARRRLGRCGRCAAVGAVRLGSWR